MAGGSYVAEGAKDSQGDKGGVMEDVVEVVERSDTTRRG